MEKILELAKKQCDNAEVFSVVTEETSVQFEANRLKNITGKQSTSVSLRVIKDGRIGYATAAGTIAPEELVGMAIETAKYGMEAKFEFPSTSKYPAVTINFRAVSSVSTEQMKTTGEKLISPLVKLNPAIICQGGVGKGSFTVKTINTRGGSGKYTKTIYSMGVEGTIIEGTDMLFVGDSESSCQPIKSTKNILDTVSRQLKYAKSQASVSTKSMPVIFTPDGAVGALLPSLATAFNGKTVLEGASPVGNKLGKKSLMMHSRFRTTLYWITGLSPARLTTKESPVRSRRLLRKAS